MPLQVLSRQAVLVRAQFEANRSVSNLAEAETLVAAGEKRCVHVCSGVRASEPCVRAHGSQNAISSMCERT